MKQVILQVYVLALIISFFSGAVFAVKLKPTKAAVNKVQVKPEDDANNFEGVKIYPGATKVPVTAKQAIVVDFNTGKVLLEKNADQRMPPSSMAKMMTTYIMEEKILAGEITNETEFLVSKKAWSTQGSKMFVHVNDKVKVADLHRGIAIQSGNDASIVAAEGIMGTEEGFAIEMNRVAKELGMANTNFTNASGLPDPNQYTNCRDLATLGAAIIRKHSQFYKVNQEKDFTYNGIKQGNRNPLLYDDIGCDGIKTGHTEEGGFGVTASCVDGSQRYIMVINGLPSMQARADEARRLMGWAKANFMGKTVIKKGDIVENASKVLNGVKETIPLMASQDVYLVMLRSEQNQVRVETNITENLTAPISEGQHAGTLTASIGDSSVKIELHTAESVEKLGWFKRGLRWFKSTLKNIGII